MSKVKICGLSRSADIEAVNRALPDFVGFVFAPSRRRVDAITAASLREKLDPRIKAVGVFVNDDLWSVAKICGEGLIDLVQLHGDEDGSYIRRIKDICGCHVIKAVGVGDRLPALPVDADYLLFDTLSAHRGGTGKAFDWNILREYSDIPYFLAGGLTGTNVADALGVLSPFCVDVSSGVETGVLKDAVKINEFVNIVRRNT